MPSLQQLEADVSSVAKEKLALPPVAGEVLPRQPLLALSVAALSREIHFSESNTLAAYVATACITTGAIVGLYWSKGWPVILRIIIYLLALSTMKLSVKQLFVDYSFNFPKFVTAMHFLSGAVVAFSVLICRKSALPATLADLPLEPCQKAGIMQRLKTQFGVPTFYEFWLMIVPISMGFAVSVAANNVALLYSSAAFTEIVAATGPVVSIGFVLLMGMPFDLRLLLPTLFVVAGCAISTSGEIHFSGLGMACCVISMVGRSFKTTLQQHIMTGDSKVKFDPVALMAWMCIPSTVLMIAWSLSVEGLAPLTMILESSRRKSLILFLSVSCTNACVLNLSNLFCTKDLGAVGVQLVAQTKSVLTVLGAVALFHEAVTPIEILGFIGVLIGVYWFTSVEKSAQQKAAS